MEYNDLLAFNSNTQRANKQIGTDYNDNFNRFVLYDSTITPLEKALYSDDNLQYIQDRLYELLRCLRTDGRPTIITKRVIAGAMSSIEYSFRPQLGNAYTMYIIPAEKLRNDTKTLNEHVIEFIYNQVKTEYDMDKNNAKLTVWTTLLGDFNEHGLRQYSTIKTNQKPINKFRFNMNY